MPNEFSKEPQDIDSVEEVNLLDYVAVIVKYRRMIFRMCTAAVVIAVLTSLLLPKIYSATAVIMPPKSEEQSIANLTSKMGGMIAFAGGMLGMPGSAEMYIDMLKSRTVADALIQRFNLKQVYDKKFMRNAIERLRENTVIESSKADAIAITVEDKDPKRAADLANAYVEELDKLNRKINISDASRQRVFLEKRLAETKQRLNKAELELKQFREDKKIMALEEQARVSIEGAAVIKGEIIAIETELQSLKGFATEESNKIVVLKQKLSELKNQLEKIETGHVGNEHSHNPGNPRNEKDSNFYIPFTQAPALGLQLARFMREVKIQETAFELLTQQHELARIAEAKDTATIQVMDSAVVPEKRTKPKRGLIVILSATLTLFVSIFLAFIFEHFDRMSDNDKERWRNIMAAIKGSIKNTH